MAHVVLVAAGTAGGAGVQEAVEQGEIAAHRYENYLNILNDNDMNLAHWELR